MKKTYLLFLFISIGLNSALAQTNQEEVAVKAAINKLFDGMRRADTTLMRQAFAAQSTMQTIAVTADGKTSVKTQNVSDFIKGIARPHPAPYDERIVFTKILIDAHLASVWTDYKFYIGDTFSHCGVNSFQLHKGEQGWQIIYVIDTRRKVDCN